ncbi:MAG: hypothetical protein QY310_15610 [Candidatus Jettenia sp. CY-1]|nr:MAG: hypothetical protein QY310_15610 [Candidatus Jettenia sp. CY-1]
MLKIFTNYFIVAGISVLSTGIVSTSGITFARETTQDEEYKYRNRDKKVHEAPDTHPGHDVQLHGLTGAEGGAGKAGSGTGGGVVGGTVGERYKEGYLGKERVREGTIDKPIVERVISNWEDEPREVAQNLIDKYGLPNEITLNRLIWHNNGPWKRTEVINKEIPHNFPAEHEDVLIQTINYQVPANKVDELVQYNGSIMVDRTRGELASQCEREEMNILALNLADDIVKGERNFDEARNTYAEQVTAVMEGKSAPLAKELQFDTKTKQTADRDMSTMDKTTMQKYKDKEIGGLMNGGRERERLKGTAPDKSTTERVISRWNEESREVAGRLIDKYGTPNEVTQTRIIWHNNGPWKRTEVINKKIPHNFPAEHEDVLIQTINYQVPADKADELVRYNGSLVVNRTRGELTSQCEREEMNILTLNLADDIVKGERNVDEARKVYTEQATATIEGKSAPLAEELQFDTNGEETADPDESVMDDGDDEGIIEKAKETLGFD